MQQSMSLEYEPSSEPTHLHIDRFQAKRVVFRGLLPESQGQNLAVTVCYVLCSFDSGREVSSRRGCEEGPWDGPASGGDKSIMST